MLTLIKEENGIKVARYIDNDGDLEKFDDVFSEERFKTKECKELLRQLINTKLNNPYYNDFYIIFLYSQKDVQKECGDEMYHRLCSIKPSRYYHALNDCNPYKKYKQFEKSVRTIEENQEDIDAQSVIVSFGYNVGEFVRRIKTEKDNFFKCLGRAIYRYEINKKRIIPGDYDPDIQSKDIFLKDPKKKNELKHIKL